MTGNYVTAEQCRKQAESWENEEIQKCVRECCSEIWKEACRGGTKTKISISTGKPEHFYETFLEKMTSLGFAVIAPEDAKKSYSNRCERAWWSFEW